MLEQVDVDKKMSKDEYEKRWSLFLPDSQGNCSEK